MDVTTLICRMELLLFSMQSISSFMGFSSVLPCNIAVTHKHHDTFTKLEDAQASVV